MDMEIADKPETTAEIAARALERAVKAEAHARLAIKIAVISFLLVVGIAIVMAPWGESQFRF
jgi:hypothetical protein